MNCGSAMDVTVFIDLRGVLPSVHDTNRIVLTQVYLVSGFASLSLAITIREFVTSRIRYFNKTFSNSSRDSTSLQSLPSSGGGIATYTNLSLFRTFPINLCQRLISCHEILSLTNLSSGSHK